MRTGASGGILQEPHVQIIVDGDPVPTPLKTALHRVGARISIRSLSKAAAAGVSPSADACVILPGPDHGHDLLEQVVSQAGDRACAAMVLAPARSAPPVPQTSAPSGPQTSSVRRLPAPEATASPDLNVDELTGRIKAMCEIRRPLRKLHDEIERLKSERHVADDPPDVDDQLRLAGQVQADLLPGPLPDTLPLTVSTLYLPADYVSGDIYEIARLDERTIGFSIADATGHGLPAALLTFLIKRSLRGKEIFNGAYRIVEPDELLTRLNEDLLHSPLSQCQFVTALHAVFDQPTGCIRWARGGCPYPILVRPGEPARTLPSDGGLIGAFDQPFEVVSRQLLPGDTLVFYTDGLDALLLRRDENAPRTILDTQWARTLEREGIDAAIQAIRQAADACGDADWYRDDITLIALRMN